MAFAIQGLQNPLQPQIPDFRNLLPRDLDTFIAQYLQPDEQFHNQVSSALDALCRYLQDKLRPRVKRIVKSGSMGKGTALKNSSDLDCVLILNIRTPTNPVQLKANISAILSETKIFLNLQPLLQQGWMVQFKDIKEHLLKFDLINLFLRKATEVDLLLTFDANVTDGQARLNLYNIMPSLDESTKFYCSVALAEIRKDFVKERPAKLKNLIRLVKHWAKTYLPSSTSTRRMPSSYLIELVTIRCWEEVGSPSSFNTAALLMMVMMEFCSHNHFDISWNRYYILNQTTSRPQSQRLSTFAAPVASKSVSHEYVVPGYLTQLIPTAICTTM